MQFKTLSFEETLPQIGLITLNRPDRLNAINMDMLEELQVLFGRLQAMESILVVILTGAGRAFCSGADLKDAKLRGDVVEQSKDSGRHLFQIQKKYAGSIMGMRGLPQPIIAAINGVAAGGGMCLSLASDITIASRKASFIPSFINIGLSGGELGSSYFLPRAVGSIRAAEILMTGRSVEAEEAEKIGLVNAVVDHDALLEAAVDKAKCLVTKGGPALRLTKESLNVNINAASLMAAIEFENRTQSICCTTSEHAAALTKFNKKSNDRV